MFELHLKALACHRRDGDASGRAVGARVLLNDCALIKLDIHSQRHVFQHPKVLGRIVSRLPRVQ